MTLDQETLMEIMTEASHRFHQQMRIAHRQNRLESFLEAMEMADLFPKHSSELFESNRNGKILIVGDSQINVNQLLGCFKQFGIPKERVEAILDYEKVSTYNFQHLQYNPNYRLILFGATPHSGKSMGDNSSIITHLENSDGYPKVVRLADDHGLKITKTGLKTALKLEIDIGYLEKSIVSP